MKVSLSGRIDLYWTDQYFNQYWLKMKEPSCKHIVIYPGFTLSKQRAMYL